MRTVSVSNRNFSVDLMKFIGTLCIILAHVGAPQLIHNIRGFDVCLLVFASGITLKNHAESIHDYLMYLKKRFLRLIIPTWSFLLIYFILCWIVGKYIDKANSEHWIYSPGYYLRSFSFIGGIGYIWIFRVYMLMAVLNPVIILVGENKRVQKWFLPVIVSLLLSNELMGVICERIGYQLFKSLFQNLICYTLGYLIVELTAYVIIRLQQKPKVMISIAFCSVCAFIWAVTGFVSPLNYKYPPRMLYLCYGISVSLLLYGCSQFFNERVKRNVIRRAIIWVSDNSLWIYLWHIIPITFFANTDNNLGWFTIYLFTLTFAISMTKAQNYLPHIIKAHERTS